MDLISERESIRAWLRDVEIQRVIDATGINRSWISKFRRGAIVDPGMDRLMDLQRCRRSFESRRPAGRVA